MDTANTAHLPYTTTPFIPFSSPQKTTETSNKKYRNGIPKNNLNTHTHTDTLIPGMPHQPYPQPIDVAIAALYTATHITPSHYNLSSMCSNIQCTKTGLCYVVPTTCPRIACFNTTVTIGSMEATSSVLGYFGGEKA